MTKRIHYIDWLRVLAVLLLFPFHTSRVFNAEPFYVKGPPATGVDAFIGFVDAWHMPLLFFVAGASTYFALRKRSGGQYMGERVQRLLLPLFFGIFLVIPPQTWYGGRFNSGYGKSFLEYLLSGDFLVWNIQDGGDYYGGFGIGHLWFLLWLFAVSLMALPLLLRAKGKATGSFARFSRFLAKPWSWPVAGFLILLGEALPDLFGKNPFYYLVFFVLGYVAMCDPAFGESAQHYRWPALIISSAVIVWWMATWRFRDSLPDPSWTRTGVTLLGMIAVWLMVLAAVGFGRRYLDRPSTALTYLAPASYPLYILHQTAIVIVAYYVVLLPAPASMQWLAVFTIAIAASFVAYEAIRHVPYLRAIVGIRESVRAHTA